MAVSEVLACAGTPSRVRSRASHLARASVLRPVPYLIPAALAALVVIAAGPVSSDWRYLGGGALIIFHGGPHGGLHTYASFTQLQIGPLSFAVVRGFVALSATHAALLTGVLTVIMLPVLIWISERAILANGREVSRGLLLAMGALAAPVWAELTLRHHLDDALAVAAVLGVAWMTAVHRPAWAVAFAVVGCAAKPWAVVAVPMLLALPRRRWRACLSAVAGAGLVYAPFIVADTGTLHAGRPNVLVSASSLLRLAGFPAGVIPSSGVRIAQLFIALALGVWLARRSRYGWLVVPVACMATRLLLDPGTFPYYAAGLAGAAVLGDMWSGRRLPVLTTIAAAVWAASYAPSAVPVALLRCALLAAMLGISLAMTDPRRRHWGIPP